MSLIKIESIIEYIEEHRKVFSYLAVAIIVFLALFNAQSFMHCLILAVIVIAWGIWPKVKELSFLSFKISKFDEARSKLTTIINYVQWLDCLKSISLEHGVKFNTENFSRSNFRECLIQRSKTANDMLSHEIELVDKQFLLGLSWLVHELLFEKSNQNQESQWDYILKNNNEWFDEFFENYDILDAKQVISGYLIPYLSQPIISNQLNSSTPGTIKHTIYQAYSHIASRYS